MAHLQHLPDVSGLQLAAASLIFARRFKDLHPSLDCVSTDTSAPFLWWKAFRYAASEDKKHLRTYDHLGLAINEEWIQRQYASRSAVVHVKVVRFEAGKSIAISQNERLSLVTSMLIQVSAIGNLLTTSDYVGVLRGTPDRPPINFHVSFLLPGQQIDRITRLRLSDDSYETPLILVENPAPLVDRALKAIFQARIPTSNLDESLHWSTLLIFHLALEAWEADTKRSLPTFPLSLASFAGLLTAQEFDCEEEHIQERLVELDARLIKTYQSVNTQGTHEQTKLETTRNVFDSIYQLLMGSRSQAQQGRRHLPTLRNEIPTFPPSKFAVQDRGVHDVEAQGLVERPARKKGYLDSLRQSWRKDDRF